MFTVNPHYLWGLDSCKTLWVTNLWIWDVRDWEDFRESTLCWSRATLWTSLLHQMQQGHSKVDSTMCLWLVQNALKGREDLIRVFSAPSMCFMSIAGIVYAKFNRTLKMVPVIGVELFERPGESLRLPANQSCSCCLWKVFSGKQRISRGSRHSRKRAPLTIGEGCSLCSSS